MQLAHAAETGGEGDVGNRQVRVVQQAPGEMGPAGSGQAVGGDAELGDEETPQMAAGYAEPGGQLILGVTVEGAVGDQLHRPADQLGPAP